MAPGEGILNRRSERAVTGGTVQPAQLAINEQAKVSSHFDLNALMRSGSGEAPDSIRSARKCSAGTSTGQLTTAPTQAPEVRPAISISRRLMMGYSWSLQQSPSAL